jgi:hypothetical protein
MILVADMFHSFDPDSPGLNLMPMPLADELDAGT